MHQRYVSTAIIPSGQVAVRYGRELLRGIDKKAFARWAPGEGGKRIKSNHPAWVYGHLACYPARVLELVGHPDAAKLQNAKFSELFKNGTECRDDPEGTIYPSMDEITGAWESGYQCVFDVLPTVSDEVFLKENPAEGRFKEMFPTVGGAVTFIIGAHQMSHLGQASAWRRFMGLPSAM